MGYLYALCGALLFGANGSLTKLLVEGGLTPTQLTQVRTVGTMLIAGGILLVVDRSAFRIPPRQILVMAILGIAGVAALQALYAGALGLLPVGIALLLQFMAVLMVPVVAFLVFHEKVKTRLWIAIGLVLAGLAVVAQVWDSRLDALGVVLALGAAVSLTVYFLIGERQVAATSPLAVAFWTMLFASAFWAPLSGWWEISPAQLVAPLEVGGAHGGFDVPLWVAIAAVVVAGSFVPFLCSFLALQRLSATAVGVVASAEVLFAFAIAWLWLGESLDPFQVAGAGVVLIGIVLAQTARSGKVVDPDLALPLVSGVGGRA